MANYSVKFTKLGTSPIVIEQGEINNTSVDVSLFGQIRLEYGEFLNENLLHLLENYACPEDPARPGNPLLTSTHENLLTSPTMGQFWYNSTDQRLYFWDGTYWIPLSEVGDVAANWGTVYHGQQLPKPISQITGESFEYDECIWSVAPATYDTSFAGMTCATDDEAYVTMHYKVSGGSTTIESYANYLIVGIRGNNNLGEQVTPPDLPGVTLTPTPTVTPTQGLTPSPTSTPVGTPPVSIPASVTPTPSPEPIAELGVDTRLYVSPADCDPGQPGPGGGTATDHITTEGTDVTKSAYDQSTYFSLQNLSGGVPPYRVDFQHVFAQVTVTGDQSGLVETGDGGTYTYGNSYPYTGFIKSYAGGPASSTASLRTDLVPGDLPYIRIKTDSASFNPNNDYHMKVRYHGRVILTDSVGSSKQWWIPASDGTDFPEHGYEGGCTAGGTNLTQPGTNGPFDNGDLTYYSADWKHNGIPEPVYQGGGWLYADHGTSEPPGIFDGASRTWGYSRYPGQSYGDTGNLVTEYAKLITFTVIEEVDPNYESGFFVIYEAVNGTTQAELMTKDFRFYLTHSSYGNAIQLHNPTISPLGTKYVTLWYPKGSSASSKIDAWEEIRDGGVTYNTFYWWVDD